MADLFQFLPLPQSHEALLDMIKVAQQEVRIRLAEEALLARDFDAYDRIMGKVR